MRCASVETERSVLSVETGVNLPSSGDTARPLFDLSNLSRVFRRLPPEAMHAAALVSYGWQDLRDIVQMWNSTALFVTGQAYHPPSTVCVAYRSWYVSSIYRWGTRAHA